MKVTSIAVVGAGFSGTLLSLHLVRKCPPGTHITLIERSAQFGLGQAYATGNPGHLLNVPAGRMSAFHDRPLHFLEWLRKCPPELLDGVSPSPDAFVPRRLFGAYVRALLNEEISHPEHSGQLSLIHGNVIGIDRSEHPLVLNMEGSPPIKAALTVLAVGNFPPEPMPIQDAGFYDSTFYRPDPWAADAVAGLDPAAPVLLIGSGLTMVDVVVSLLDQGHRGPITALSRRGLLPQRHQANPTPSGDSYEYPAGLAPLFRFVRNEARRAVSRGGDWRPVIDALRPATQDIWQAMPYAERARFLRHLRPWWDVHRHRMAGAVADRIQAALNRQQLRVLAGRIRDFRPRGGLVEAIYRPRGAAVDASLEAARVINCAGPMADYDRIADPLVRALLREGTARPDALRLGLDVTSTCALRLGSGAISRRLFAVGPVTKGAFWESTAVPDIRRQCELLAQNLATLVKSVEAGRQPEHSPRIAANFPLSATSRLPMLGQRFSDSPAV